MRAGVSLESRQSRDSFPPPGGVSDLVTHAVAEPLSKSRGQPVLAENRPGAGGTAGAQFEARSAPDGYTLLLGGGNLVIAPNLYKSLQYDPQRNFAPIALIARGQFVLVVHPQLPVDSVSGLIQLAKSRPGQLRDGSSGVGAPPHLAGELFKSLARINVLHVPYKGSLPGLTDLMGGRIDMVFDSVATSLPHVRAEKLRALGVSAATRSLAAPDVPPIAESGLPEYDLSSFYALVAPSATPSAVLGRLSSEVTRVASSPDVRQRLVGAALDPAPLSRVDLAAVLKKERGTGRR